MDYRFKFSRGDAVKYISHLDIMKVFEMAMRRGGVKVSYSKGFNPHPQIVFGLPMGVGLVSLAECADVSLDENILPDDLKKRLNDSLPEGFSVLDVKVKLQKKNIMSQIVAARYEFVFSLGSAFQEEMLLQKIDEFLKRDNIMVLKKSKKSDKHVDIRPLILEINLKDKKAFQEEFKDVKGGDFKGSNRIGLDVLVRAGQNGNLKPSLFLDAMSQFLSGEVGFLKIVRRELYVEDEGGKLALPF